MSLQWLLLTVHSEVVSQFALVQEGLVTVRALEWLLFTVHRGDLSLQILT